MGRLFFPRAMQKPIFSIVLLLCCCLELAGTFAASLICMHTPNLTDRQRNICMQVPEVMPVMNEINKTFEDECSWQFITNRWNCTGVRSPIYIDSELEENPESAFVYALTSAITVQKIAEACYEHRLGNFCSADNSRVGERSPEGWVWGSGYDVDEGIVFAQRFLDSRELLGLANPDKTIKARIHLHNNAAGRRVVDDSGRRLRCICHGMSGSCSLRTCYKDIPSIFDIGDIMKVKYDEAVKVNVIVRANGEVDIETDDRRREEDGAPSPTDLIFIAPSVNHCMINPEYTTSRYCIPHANLTTALSKFYPPCEDLCCSGNYQSERKTIRQSCNCFFEFCCDLKCDTCEETYSEYQCLDVSNDTSSARTTT